MKVFKHINWYLSDYFGMSRSEARGFLLVLFFAFMCIITPLFLKKHFSQQPISLAKEEKDFFEYPLNNSDNTYRTNEKTLRNYHEINIEKFNPNLISVNEWEVLGLPSQVAKRISKYLKKGGQFKKKEDLKKIYGFPKETYLQLSPYFVFTSDLRTETVTKNNLFKIKQLHIDLNATDSIELTKLDGIGAKLARRIILYRNSLGGFYDKKQIKEIYGLDSITYLKILPQLSIDKNFQTKKLSISQTDNSVWFKHPYFRKIAKEIIQQKKLKPHLNKTAFFEYFSKSEIDREKWNAYLMD
jgi:competence protein ComEA